MKSSRFTLLLSGIIASAVSFTSCLNDNYDTVTPSTGFSGFDFKSTKEVKVNVQTLSNTNQGLSGVHVELYTKNPLTSTGTLADSTQNNLIYKGVTLADGKMTATIAPATSVDSIYALVNYVGLESYQVVKFGSSDEISFVFGGSSSAQSVRSKAAPQKVSNAGIWYITNFWKVNDLYALATWNNSGVPANLEAANDVISASLLADVNASLPESKPVPTYHPEYLTSSEDGSIVLVEDAEVWVTFVHEGAGYTNALSYYSYPTATPPATKADVKYNTIVFPNVSFAGSGGNLKSGNKVRLMYFDQANNRYTNLFPAGTTVSWMIRSNGWNGSTVGNGYYSYFSNSAFNPETNPSLRKHNIILKDDARKLLLIGFEDLRRDNGSDNDFNDAVFYATVTPYTAVKTGIYKTIETPVDTDGDGVSDTKDEYPTDATKAYNNYYPAKDVKGTLAFEDLWPSKGDYDFNDMVVDYNFNQITNGQNNVVEIEAALTLRAIGAHYANAFALQLNTAPGNIASVTGQNISKNIFTLNANGTEANQDKAVIVAFDNAYKVMNKTGGYVNTVTGSSYSNPQIVNLSIKFSTPVATADLGSAPYNPFIVVNETRGREVHLSGYAPTALVDPTLFGKGQDGSNPLTGKYYTSDKYLPWALNIPVQFDYPAEKEDITKAYLMFNTWALGRGATYTDWYTNKTGYRDTQKLYAK
ncbi:MAG: hypothetical protein RIS29_1551 [Bacteroidota bacterium]|jgi:LruC domain-containing protein